MLFLNYLVYFPALLKVYARIRWGREYRRLLATIVPGEYDYTGNFNKKIPLDQKFAAIKGEFQGSNELSFEMARRIICIRRGISPKVNWIFMFGALLNHPREIYSGLTLRWIISVLDTISDMPSPRRYKLAAGEIRNFVLGLRLGLSVALQSVPDPKIRNEPLHHFPKRVIWDGIIHFDYKIGDTYRNLIQRVAREVESIPLMSNAWRFVLLRIAKYPPFEFAFTHNEKSRAVFDAATKDQPPS